MIIMTYPFSFQLQHFRAFSFAIALRLQGLHFLSYHFCDSFHVFFVYFHFVNFFLACNKNESIDLLRFAYHDIMRDFILLFCRRTLSSSSCVVSCVTCSCASNSWSRAEWSSVCNRAISPLSSGSETNENVKTNVSFRTSLLILFKLDC